MQKLGITCVSDGGLTNYMWMDSGRLLISNHSGYEGDTREKDTVTMYVKTANMNNFIVAATTGTTSEGYSSLVAATSNSIGFAIQYGANVLLDNLIVYSGYGNPPAIDNQENYYKAQ